MDIMPAARAVPLRALPWCSSRCGEVRKMLMLMLGCSLLCPWLAVCGQQAVMADALGTANAPAVWVCPASCSGWVPLAAKLIGAGSLVVP